MKIRKNESLIHSLEKPEKQYFIYALLDPDTNHIRYIGLSTTGFQRIRYHYNNCYKNKEKSITHNQFWIRKLRDENKIFKVEYLEYFDKDGIHIDEAECFYITYFRALGCSLNNHTDGGRGEFGFYSTDQMKKKISDSVKRIISDPRIKQKIKNRPKQSFNEEARIKSKEKNEQLKLIFKDQFGNIYCGLDDCSKKLNMTKPRIYRALKGFTKNPPNGYIFTLISGGTGKELYYKRYQDPKKGRKPVENKIIDSNGNIYLNAKEAAKQLNLQHRQIFRLLSGECKTTKLGLSLKYLEK